MSVYLAYLVHIFVLPYNYVAVPSLQYLVLQCWLRLDLIHANQKKRIGCGINCDAPSPEVFYTPIFVLSVKH